MSRKILWEKWVTPLKPEDSDAEKEFIIFTPIDTLLQKFLTNNKNNMRFWGGNTNFNISPMVSNIIEKTEGVEILSIYARYRFRIGIGRLFDSKQVRENIELALGCTNKYDLDNDVVLSVRTLIGKLKKDKIPWLVYVLPNGKYDYIQEVDQEKFQQQLANFTMLKNSIGGYLLNGV